MELHIALEILAGPVAAPEHAEQRMSAVVVLQNFLTRLPEFSSRQGWEDASSQFLIRALERPLPSGAVGLSTGQAMRYVRTSVLRIWIAEQKLRGRDVELKRDIVSTITPADIHACKEQVRDFVRRVVPMVAAGLRSDAAARLLNTMDDLLALACEDVTLDALVARNVAGGRDANHKLARQNIWQEHSRVRGRLIEGLKRAHTQGWLDADEVSVYLAFVRDYLRRRSA